MESEKDIDTLVSILICSRDRRADLERLVAMIRAADSPCSFEMVVIEETDSPRHIDGSLYVAHPLKNLGIPFARNLALQHAKGSIVIFIDDDCIPSGDWLARLLTPFQENSVVGVQGGVTVPMTSTAIGWAESILGFPGGGIRRVVEAQKRKLETKEISTLNCAYRKWVIDSIGGFDERLTLGDEDYILAKQACRYGRCLFVPDAIVSHMSRGNLLEIWRWFVRRGRSEMNAIRIRGAKEYDPRMVIRSSIGAKLFILIVAALALRIDVSVLLAIALFSYLTLQYLRYFRPWKRSGAPLKSLFWIPAVKLDMDLALDWGRIRGLLFG